MKVHVNGGFKEAITLDLDASATLLDVKKSLAEKGVSMGDSTKFLHESLMLSERKPLFAQGVKDGSKINRIPMIIN